MAYEELLASVSQGDEKAFSELYDEVGGKLYAIALLILKRADQAEDITQEAFLRIWQQAPTYASEKGTPMAWMATILRRLAIDRIRSIQRQLRTGKAYEEEILIDTINITVPQNEDNDQIWECLQQLDKERANLISLSFVGGYTHEELAENCQKPLGTVKSSIRRGLQSLKKCLEEKGE